MVGREHEETFSHINWNLRVHSRPLHQLGLEELYLQQLVFGWEVYITNTDWKQFNKNRSEISMAHPPACLWLSGLERPSPG